MKILCVGDIFGKPGRAAIKNLLPVIKERERIDFIVANAENSSGGRGLNPKAAEELFESPIDVMTAGNHIWEFDTIHPYFNSHNILRPFNTREKLPGRGYLILPCKGLKIGVVCLQGEKLMDEKGKPVVNPFKTMEELLRTLGLEADIIVVDFHAEATSEKRALAWYLDGRITTLFGTHTHIQTADEEIMPGGTAYITDLGMTGPHDSVIGLQKEVALKRFLGENEKGFKVAKGGVRLEGVVVEVDELSKKAVSIKRIKEIFEENKNDVG